MARRSKLQRKAEELLAYQTSMLAVDLDTAIEGLNACTRLLDSLGDGYELPETIFTKLLNVAEKVETLIDKLQ